MAKTNHGLHGCRGYKFVVRWLKEVSVQLSPAINAVIRPGDQSGYVAECIEIAVVTQGRTLEEVSANLKEAIELHLEIESLPKDLLSVTFIHDQTENYSG